MRLPVCIRSFTPRVGLNGRGERGTADRPGCDPEGRRLFEGTRVGRFVVINTLLAYAPERAPEALRHYARMKCESDDYLIASGLDYLVLRPGTFSPLAHVEPQKTIGTRPMPTGVFNNAWLTALAVPGSFRLTVWASHRSLSGDGGPNHFPGFTPAHLPGSRPLPDLTETSRYLEWLPVA
jgi:hypothetical protein